MRILVVEDEPRLAELLGGGLRRAGFATDLTATAADAQAAARAVDYDVVVLDLGLPDADGTEVLRDLRARGEPVPLLVLTARDAVEDRVAALNGGADDYLLKPFAMDELVARIKALLRRPRGALGVRLEAANLSFDTAGREVFVAGRPVALGNRELAMLEHLMRRLGHVVPKRTLEDGIYAFGEEVASNSVEVIAHRLRRKLADAGAAAHIHTVRGVGYLLSNGER